MAQAFVMTTLEPWVGDRRALWVVLADSPIWLWKQPALMAAMLTESSERCPRRRLNALAFNRAEQCISDAKGPHRFPPPWRADKIPGGYVVRDANGQAL